MFQLLINHNAMFHEKKVARGRSWSFVANFKLGGEGMEVKCGNFLRSGVVSKLLEKQKDHERSCVHGWCPCHNFFRLVRWIEGCYGFSICIYILGGIGKEDPRRALHCPSSDSKWATSQSFHWESMTWFWSHQWVFWNCWSCICLWANILTCLKLVNASSPIFKKE
jgi:hypothetical protein